MKRRAFVRKSVALASAGALFAATELGCNRPPVFTPEELARPRLLEGLELERVRAIGEQYLERTPAEQSAELLREAIEQSARTHGRFPWSGTPTLDAMLQADFEADRVVFPDGWMLSVTEARQCALFALTAT